MIGKKKGNSKVLEWTQSIKNHVYWCAASSDGIKTLVKEKWLSILNHIIDKHADHGTVYKECPHEKIKREWLKRVAFYSAVITVLRNSSCPKKSNGPLFSR